MKHSCGHKAPSGTPHQIVRAAPRCEPCQNKRDALQRLDRLVTQVTALYPNLSATKITDMLLQGAQLGRGQVNLARVIENATNITANHAREEEAYHAITGD